MSRSALGASLPPTAADAAAEQKRKRLEVTQKYLSELLTKHQQQKQLEQQLAASRKRQTRRRRPEHVVTEEMMRVGLGGDVMAPGTPPRRGRRSSILNQPNATLTPRLVTVRPATASPLKNDALQRRLRQQVRAAGDGSDCSSREASPSRGCGGGTALATAAPTMSTSSSQHRKHLQQLHVSATGCKLVRSNF